MKTNFNHCWLLISILFVFESAFSQENLTPLVKSPAFFDQTPALNRMPVIRTGNRKKTREIRNKTGPRAFRKPGSNGSPLTEDPVRQKTNGPHVPAQGTTIQNFEGMPNLSMSIPPDPHGDAGPDHYFQVVNTDFTIYDKTGNVLYGPASLGTIWQGIPYPWEGNDGGDPIVLYDQAADRWIISQLSLPLFDFAELVAISQTSDPTGPWYRYVYEFGEVLPDYPKFGIWPDGYYLSVNQFLNMQDWAGVGAIALDRTAMLAGDPDAQLIYFDLGAASDPVSMLPSDWDGSVSPLPGEPNYFMYFNDWSSPSEDYLKIWQFSANWTNPSASTFTSMSSLVTAPFESAICPDSNLLCIPQPGTGVKLMSISDRLMYRLQYRNFGTHRSMVANHTVNASSGGPAGIRWYEFRNSGSGWSIYQQGTYAPDQSHRWMGSIAMNAQGDIALGYTVSDNASTYPSIRFTGRKDADPPGLMTVAEQNIIAGTGHQTNENGRWGDYSMMSVDPADDLTFWYTNEYIQTSDDMSWQTRIASIKKMNDSPDVITLPATNVTLDAATLNGSVNPNGFATNYHFEWGTTTTYGNSTTVLQAGSGTTPTNVTGEITGLSTGFTYHFRLVATNSVGTTHGRDLTLTPGIAVVVTLPASNVTSSGATAGGNITSDGGHPVTARGICWSTVPDPNIAGNHTSDGYGVGTFTTTLTGLLADNTYHIRAYATTESGTYYGSDRTFHTICGLATLPLSQNFSGPAIPACWHEQVEGSGVVNSWSLSPTNFAGGTAGEMVSEGQEVFEGTTRLASVPFSTIGMSQLNLSFRYALDSWFPYAYLQVQSSSDGISWTDESWGVETTEYGIPATVVNTTITHNLNSSTTYIGFTVTGALIVYFYWYIDDVTVDGVCGMVTTFPWQEGFRNTGTIPPCWSQADHQGNGQVWQFGTVSQQNPLPALSGNYAFIDSHGYGSGSSQNADLVTPTLNVSALPYARLKFNHYFKSSPGSSGTLSYSTDNGVTWMPFRQFNTTSLTNPEIFDQVIPNVTGYSQVRFKWNYTGSYGEYWAIDSIEVSGIPDELNLRNLTIGDTRCYDAYHTITVAGNGSVVTVLNGGDVTLMAGQRILFLPVVTVMEGGYLRGFIASGAQNCGTLSNPLPGRAETAATFPENEEDKMNGTFFRVWPNPTPGMLTIEIINKTETDNVKIEIFNMIGRRILVETLPVRINVLSLSNLPDGIYLLHIISGNESGTIKIIKQ